MVATSQDSQETEKTAVSGGLSDTPCAEPAAAADSGDTLTRVQDSVSQLKAEFADAFHALSGTLQTISEQARDIAEHSCGRTTASAVEQSEAAVMELQNVLDNVEQVRSMGDSSVGPLRNVLEHLQQSRAPLKRLAGLPFLLSTVGMLSRIESSRLGKASAEACSLADDIGSLAAQIEQHTTALMTEFDRLPSVITHSLSQLEEMRGRQQQQGEDLVGRAQSVLAPLRERARVSREVASKVAEQYAGIRSATVSIVMSLQCDDIARQRLEHVEQALARAQELERSDNLRACGEVVTLQRSQLLSTRNLISGALQSFLSNVQSLSSHLQQLTADTATFANQTDQEGQSIASVMENGLRAVSSILEQYSASAQATVSTVEELLPSVSGMSNRAKALRGIAASIRRTALNARIETSHLGEKGSTLRVLSGEVQQITEGSDKEAQSVLEGLSVIDRELAALSSHCAISGTATTASKDLSAKLSTLIASVRNSNQQVSAGLRVLLNKSEALAARLQETGTQAERGIQITCGFSPVLQQLEGMVKQLGADLNIATPSAVASGTADLATMYSMQSEREVHKQVFTGAESVQEDIGSGDDIELF